MNTTRERIIDAAASLMLDRGYAGTTVDEIVAGAGVAKGSVYHFFDSKESVGLAALQAYFERGKVVVMAGPFDAVEDPVQRALALVDHVRAVSGQLWEHGCLAGSFAVELSAVSPAIRAAIAGWFTQFEVWLAGYFQAIAAAASAPDVPTGTELAAQLLAVIEGGIVMGRARGDSTRLGAAIDEFRRYLVTLLD
ncbi:MAG TPA: TetR/AcrR family transcriptional regulator [Longimicrobiales bacterium]|nr:TetR/AcrR family transcriptional regulator [Longimicrobiales bacterium]